MGNQQLLGDEFGGENGDVQQTPSTSSDEIDIKPYYDSASGTSKRTKKVSTRRKKPKSSRRDRGYTSDVISSKKHHEEVIKIPTSSSSPIQEPPPIVNNNWWKKFNGNAIDPDSNDAVFLFKNSKYIDDLLNDFEGIMALVADRIENLNELKESNTIHPYIIHLIDEISMFGIENTHHYTVLQAKKIQDLSSITMISMITDECLKRHNHRNTIVFNIFELVSFYYDLFWISFALNVKTQSDRSDEVNWKKYSNFPHFVFPCLFKPISKNMKPMNRSRMNMSEYITSAFFMHLCINMKTRYTLSDEDEEYSIQLIFPQDVLDGKKIDKKDIEQEKIRKNIMACACLLLFLGAPKSEIEQYGMKIIEVDQDLYRRFGDQTERIVNDILIENIQCVVRIITQTLQTWSYVINQWNELFERFVLHNEENAYESAFNPSTSEILFDDMLFFKFMIPSKKEYETAIPTILNTFSISSNNVINTMKMQKKENGDFFSMPHSDKLVTFLNIAHHKDLGVIKTDFAHNLLCLLCFQYDVLNVKRFIGQWFVVRGNLTMNRFEKETKKKYGYNVVLYNEIKISIIPFLMANFRFFPSFDLLLTLYHGSKSRYITCHVNFEYLANTFIINNFIFDANNRNLTVNFNISIKKIRQAILYNPSVATKKQRPPTRDESIFIPFSWVENLDDRKSYAIAQHIKQDLDAAYKMSDKFTISNLKIGSFTKNDIVKTSAVVLSSEKISKIVVDRDDVYNDRIAKTKVINAYNMYGSSIFFDDGIDPNKMDIESKEAIMGNVKHAELMKSRDNVKNVIKCDPVNIGICINGFDTFTHELTQIKCINAFNISMMFEEKDFYNMIEQWSLLYMHWPLQTSRLMESCVVPKI